MSYSLKTAGIKGLLGITVTTWDAQITALLPAMIEQVVAETNIELVEDEETEELTVPAALTILIASDIALKLADYSKAGIASESLGDHSVSYTANKGVMSEMEREKVIRAFRLAKTW